MIKEETKITIIVRVMIALMIRRVRKIIRMEKWMI